MKLSIVIPVYNEKTTILELIKKVDNINLEKEIIYRVKQILSWAAEQIWARLHLRNALTTRRH